MTNTDLAAQYRDSSKLAARRNLHLKYGRAPGLANLAELIEIAPGSKVLDVGCGPASFWPSAAARLPADLSITLVDQSPGMVREAVATVSGVGKWTAVEGEVADVCALPFLDSAFDVATAMHMLYHAPDPELGVREIARVLRPGGAAIVTTNGDGHLRELFDLNRRAFGEAAGDREHRAFSLESGAPILRRSFAHVEVSRSVDELAVTDPEDVVAYLTSFPPGDEPGADVARLRDLTQRAFAAAGDGVLRVCRDTGYMVARKA